MNPLYIFRLPQQTEKTDIKTQEKALIKPYNEAEIQISVKIREIPFFFHYFSPIHSWQRLNMKEKYVLIFQDDFTLFRDFFQSISKYCRNSEKNGKYFISMIMSSYSHLLKTFQLLHNSGIVYGNFKKIGFTRQNQPILFDFEKSWTDFTWTRKEMQDMLPYLPIEAHLLYFLQDGQNKSFSLDNITDICANYTTIVEFSEPVSVSLFTHLINKPKPVLIEELTRHKYSWDIFGTSVMYFQVLKEQRKKIPELFNIFVNPFINTFIKHLKKNIYVDASKRPSVTDALLFASSGLARFA